jgi:hypothetical protein
MVHLVCHQVAAAGRPCVRAATPRLVSRLVLRSKVLRTAGRADAARSCRRSVPGGRRRASAVHRALHGPSASLASAMCPTARGRGRRPELDHRARGHVRLPADDAGQPVNDGACSRTCIDSLQACAHTAPHAGRTTFEATMKTYLFSGGLPASSPCLSRAAAQPPGGLRATAKVTIAPIAAPPRTARQRAHPAR